MLKSSKPYFVYIVRCIDGTLYTGATSNIEKRVAQHNAQKGAKYTRSRAPVTAVYSKEFESWSLAIREEARIKRLSKREKEELVRQNQMFLL